MFLSKQQCALITLWTGIGFLLDGVGENASIVWFESLGGTLEQPLYLIYLFCRTQCFILYALRHLLPYAMGLMVHVFLTVSILRQILMNKRS